MSTCSVSIQNSSGTLIDAIMMWHTSSIPTIDELVPDLAIIQGTNFASGATLTGTAQLSSLSPTDFWSAGVLYHGSTGTYELVGFDDQPYKEYEVSGGSTITFILDGFEEQAVTIQSTGGDVGSAFLRVEGDFTKPSIRKAIATSVASLL